MSRTQKKSLALWVSLVVIDQAVKLLIACRFPAARFAIIPGFLRFSPVQNRDLSWYASLADYQMSTAQMVFMQIAAAVLAALVYIYFTFLWGKRQTHLSHFLIFFESGIFCSFLDVIFWGGSLDFIALLNWFVFDLKDVCLSVSIVFLLLFCMDYLRKYYRLGEEERKQLKRQHSFSQWIKSFRRTVK